MTDTNTDSNDESNSDKISRRRVITSAAAIAAAGAAGVGFAGSASAEPSGTFPSTSDDPLELIRADRVRLVPRTTDPSDPSDGTEWYNPEA